MWGEKQFRTHTLINNICTEEKLPKHMKNKRQISTKHTINITAKTIMKYVKINITKSLVTHSKTLHKIHGIK